jgi:DNA polymerase-3 subunit alpha/error-prone DNA polymerase
MNFDTSVSKNASGLAEMNRFWPSIISINTFALEAPAFESVIIIYAFAKRQLKTNEYIGVRPEEIGKLFGYKGSLEKW